MLYRRAVSAAREVRVSSVRQSFRTAELTHSRTHRRCLSVCLTHSHSLDRAGSRCEVVTGQESAWFSRNPANPQKGKPPEGPFPTWTANEKTEVHSTTTCNRMHARILYYYRYTILDRVPYVPGLARSHATIHRFLFQVRFDLFLQSCVLLLS